MKRLLSIIIAFLLVLPGLLSVTGAVSPMPTEEIYVSLVDVEKIEALYALRNELSLNFEENVKEIEAIDRKLHALNVKGISAEYVQQRQRNDANTLAYQGENVAPMAELSDDTDITSYMYQTTYRGTLFVLEVITYVPVTRDSTLVERYTIIPEHKEVTQQSSGQAVIGFLAQVAGDALAELFEIDLFYSIATNVVELLELGGEYLNASDIIDYSSEAIVFESATTRKDIYVKASGALDTDFRISYSGNRTRYSATVTYTCGFTQNGEYIPKTDAFTADGISTSKHYDESHARAAEVFYKTKYLYEYPAVDFTFEEMLLSLEFPQANGQTVYSFAEMVPVALVGRVDWDYV